MRWIREYSTACVCGSGGRRSTRLRLFCVFRLELAVYGRTRSASSDPRGGFASVHAHVSVSAELGDSLGQDWHGKVPRFRINKKLQRT